MDNQKKIKIYVQKEKYISSFFRKEKIERSVSRAFGNFLFKLLYYVGLVVIKTFNFFWNGLFKTCYVFGEKILNFVVKYYRAAKSDILKTFENLPKRWQRIHSLHFARSLFLFICVAIMCWTGLFGLGLAAKGLGLKDRILKTALVGNIYFNRAKSELASEDFSQAANSFAKAYSTFDNGQRQLDEVNKNFALLLNLLPQKNDASRLLTAASLVAQAGENFINLRQDVSQLTVGASGLGSKDRPLAELYQNVSDELTQSLNKLSSAQPLINQINPANIPAGKKQDFVALKSQLALLNTSLQNFSDIFRLAGNLFLGDKNLLVLFENNNELRATGGFIGTYGNFKISNGRISSVTVSSIYDLDGQLDDVIQPPQPLLNVNDRWYLRDANWFADFPSSAKIISNFYEKEGGETPDVIIALTPQLIVDLLKITGPITLNNGKLVLNSDNFVEQIQAATTLSENSPTNSPKQALADLVPVLLQKLSQTDASLWPQVIEALQNNLNQRQIVAYSRNDSTQQELAAFHWDGSILNSDRDYLSINSSNLGGTKSDLYMDETNQLTTKIDSDGSIVNELTITRTNKQPDLPGTENTAFLRIFVPKGSQLISVLGFDLKNLNYPQNLNYKINDQVYDWEKHSLTDVLSGTTIGQESDKTFFGNWLTVKGGQSRTIKLVYKLPFTLDAIDRYSLLLQKQIGQIPQDFVWQAEFDNRAIAWKNFDPKSLDVGKLNTQLTWDSDYLFGMVLQKN